ncbi:MAG: glycosyltransferase family 4 protein [Planctomycetes bacterium]|nr:glycosyltransferase family 4 protein [Planctomycetota bacterium]
MRLLLTLDHWGLIGGSERYAGLIAAALAARGHTVAVLAGAEREPRLSLPRGARLLVHAAYSDGAAPAAALDAMVAAGREFRPDVVLVLACFVGRTFEALGRIGPLVRFVQDHTLFCPSLNKIERDGSNCTRPLGLVCLERYFLSGGCSCFQQSGRVRPWIEGVGEFRKKLAEFQRAKSVQRLVVASRYMQRELVAAGDLPLHVAVIPYFVPDVAPSSPPPRERGEQDPLILCPARLVLPDKGLDVLLEALSRVSLPFRAEIPGEGPARPWLEARARALGLEGRVHFPGWLSAERLAQRYREARVVAFPSTWQEPFGLIGIEAGAHGKPVVAFDVGGVSEWLDPSNGFLHARGDVAGFAESLSRLCGDAELALRLGIRGRERAQREFSEEAHLTRLEAVLSSAAR